MSELEMKVEALMRCVPRDVWARAMGEVANSAVQENDADRDLTQEIHRILGELGMPAHIKGYRYLVYALELAVRDEELLESVTKILYPTVAEKFKTTESCVERAIRHAIEVTWDRGDLDVIYSYFGNSINQNKGKPTNLEFLAKLATCIRLRSNAEQPAQTWRYGV